MGVANRKTGVQSDTELLPGYWWMSGVLTQPKEFPTPLAPCLISSISSVPGDKGPELLRKLSKTLPFLLLSWKKIRHRLG